MSFKEWAEERLKLELQAPPQTVKKWSASKEYIMKLWNSLNPSVPIQVSPISTEHKGSTYGEDGVRITGSPAFIHSVLSKLKTFLEYENPSTKLAVSYRETQSPSQLERGNLKKSYVFYVQVKQRKDSDTMGS
jgi:hypothetical protein